MKLVSRHLPFRLATKAHCERTQKHGVILSIQYRSTASSAEKIYRDFYGR
jgi:hypothetical protein